MSVIKKGTMVWVKIPYKRLWKRGFVMRHYGITYAINICGSHVNLEAERKNIEEDKETDE